jgi:hypothetical protein
MLEYDALTSGAVIEPDVRVPHLVNESFQFFPRAGLRGGVRRERILRRHRPYPICCVTCSFACHCRYRFADQ